MLRSESGNNAMLVALKGSSSFTELNNFNKVDCILMSGLVFRFSVYGKSPPRSTEPCGSYFVHAYTRIIYVSYLFVNSSKLDNYKPANLLKLKLKS